MESVGWTPVPTFLGRASSLFRGVLAFLLLGIVASTVVALAAPPTGSDAVDGVIGTLMALFVVASVFAAFHQVTLQVEPTQVVIRYGSSPFRTRIRLEEIEDVSTRPVRAMLWGGVGYRGSRRLGGRAAIIVRSGEALQLHLAHGSLLIVTVDDAEHAAEAIRVARGG